MRFVQVYQVLTDLLLDELDELLTNDKFIQYPLKYKIQQPQEYGYRQTDGQNHPSVLDSLASSGPAYFGKLDSDLFKEIN